MAEKTLKTRIIHKHDEEKNWLKATGFVPKQGELIVYDKDSNYNYERIKVGDGATNVNDLPFADANKVDKEDGKGLSTNDFTTDEKNKLAGIDENANNYTLPTASSTLGGVKTTSTVTSTTGLTATPIIDGVPYYKDNNITYSAGTGISITNNTINHSNSLTAKTSYGSTSTSANANGGSFTITDVKYDAQGHITGSTDRTIKLSQTTYTLSGLGGVPTSRKVNGHALTADISLTASEVGAITGISGADVIDALGYTPVNQANLGDFTGASATQAGDAGLVPAPSAGDQEKFLRGDGAWAMVSTSGGDYLPLTGGTLTGNLTVNGTISVNTTNRAATAENILADKGGVASDADTCLTVGVYATDTNTTNLPFSTYGTLTVYKSTQNWVIQIWTSSTSTESSMYVRKNINNEGFGSWHKLLGSDLPVSIAQGGTGGTTASGALSNLGAFAKTGGTITGDTTISASLTVMPGHIYPQMVLRKTENGSWISYGAVMEDAFLAQVIYEGAGGNREYYMLPSYTVGRTGSDWYNILTTKTVIYSSTQPSNASAGTIWLKPV